MPVVLQAGAAWWTRVEYDRVDAEEVPHFGFPCDVGDDELLRLVDRLSREQLFLPPPFHAWLAVEGTDEIVDFSSGTFVRLAARRKLDWRASVPPNVFCGVASPPRNLYIPSIPASLAALEVGTRLWGGQTMQPLVKVGLTSAVRGLAVRPRINGRNLAWNAVLPESWRGIARDPEPRDRK